MSVAGKNLKKCPEINYVQVRLAKKLIYFTLFLKEKS